jgi:hypothetical protein
MSEISTRLREFVNDPSVSDHYGEWGALRPDQRRQIRELCDVCDGYERAADNAMFELEKRKWISVTERLPEKDATVLVYCRGGIWEMIGIYSYEGENEWRDFLGYYCSEVTDKMTHWMPLPEPPERSNAE